MATTELASASWSGFYDNDPWLNQANWQKYFGIVLKNGTPSSDISRGMWVNNLTPHVDINGNVSFSDGIVYANGIAVEFADIPTFETVGEGKFYFVRVDPENRTGKLIATDVAYSNQLLSNLLSDPTTLCVDEYDVPIAYQYGMSRLTDLRRFIEDREERDDKGYQKIVFPATSNPLLVYPIQGYAYGYDESATVGFLSAYTGRSYDVVFDSGCGIEIFNISPNPVCSSEPASFTLTNNTIADIDIRLGSFANNLRISYLWAASWISVDTNTIKKTLASGATMTFILTPVSIDGTTFNYAVSSPSTSEGGEIDPETLYTKSEVNALLDEKANVQNLNNLAELVDTKTTAADLAVEWEAGEIYLAGDVVLHNNRLYRFIVNSQGAEWNASAVEPVTIQEYAESILAGKADAENVYSKTETDALLDDKANVSDVYSKTDADALLTDKADSSSVYTKSEADALLAEKADSTAVYTKEEVDSLIPEQTGYTKDEADALLTEKADAADVYTKEESDDRYAGDVATRSALSEKANVNDVYNKTQIDSFLSPKANAADVYTKTEVYNKTEIDAALALQPADKLYVDNVRGSNNNDGRTVNTAFKTIQKAIDMVPVSYPTTIMLVPGEYNEAITIDNNKIIYLQGTSNSEIKFNPTNGVPITVQQNSYLEIAGKYFIDMTNRAGYAIQILDNSIFLYKKISNNDTLTISNNQYLYNIKLTGNSTFIADAKIIIYNPSINSGQSAFEAYNSSCKISQLDYLGCGYWDYVARAYSSIITISVLNSDARKYIGRTSIVLVAKEDDSDDFDYYTKSEINKLIGIDADAAFYVDYLSGSDDNDGLTRETAFKTYSKAISACPENFASKINVVAYPAGTRNSEFKIDVSGKKITFKGYMNDKIYTSGIYARNNAYLRFESEVKVEGTDDCVRAERNSYIDFVPTGYMLPDVKINIVGIATQYGAGYPYSYNKRIIAATYGSTIIIPGTVEAGVVVSGSGSSYQEGHATNNAVDADTGSNIYIGNLNIKGYSDHTIFESNGSTIMYGSLTKSGGTTKTVSNGGVVRTGSAG